MIQVLVNHLYELVFLERIISKSKSDHSGSVNFVTNAKIWKLQDKLCSVPSISFAIDHTVISLFDVESQFFVTMATGSG